MPGINDDVRFSGGPAANKPVTVSLNAQGQSPTVNTVTFTMSYTATMDLNRNVTLEAVNGFTLNNNPVVFSTIDFGFGSKLQSRQGQLHFH